LRLNCMRQNTMYAAQPRNHLFPSIAHTRVRAIGAIGGATGCAVAPYPIPSGRRATGWRGFKREGGRHSAVTPAAGQAAPGLAS
jgi:hypothetical protein